MGKQNSRIKKRKWVEDRNIEDGKDRNKNPEKWRKYQMLVWNGA